MLNKDVGHAAESDQLDQQAAITEVASGDWYFVAMATEEKSAAAEHAETWVIAMLLLESWRPVYHSQYLRAEASVPVYRIDIGKPRGISCHVYPARFHLSMMHVARCRNDATHGPAFKNPKECMQSWFDHEEHGNLKKEKLYLDRQLIERK